MAVGDPGGEEEADGWHDAFRAAAARMVEDWLRDLDDLEFDDLFEQDCDGGEVFEDMGWMFEPSSVEENAEEKPEDGQRPNYRRPPQLPTRQEVLEHELAHVPFRPWCVHCRRAMGRSDRHHKKGPEKAEEDKESSVITFSIDYMCFKKAGVPIPHRDEGARAQAAKDGTLGAPVMAAYDRGTKTGYLHQVTGKGLAAMYIPEKLVEDIDGAGYLGCRLVTKSDQERSVSSVENFVSEHRQ